MAVRFSKRMVKVLLRMLTYGRSVNRSGMGSRRLRHLLEHARHRAWILWRVADAVLMTDARTSSPSAWPGRAAGPSGNSRGDGRRARITAGVAALAGSGG